MRYETFSLDEMNALLKQSNFHPTAEFAQSLRDRVVNKLINSTIQAAIDQAISAIDDTLPTIDDHEASQTANAQADDPSYFLETKFVPFDLNTLIGLKFSPNFLDRAA